MWKVRPDFAPGLAQRPQPGHVDVGMTAGNDVDVQGGAGLLDAGAQNARGPSGTLA